MIKCPLPWVHMTINTCSTVQPCCMSYLEHDKMTWRKSDFIEGLESEVYKEMRNQLLNDEWPKICQVCKWKEAEGLKSPRQTTLGKTSIPKTNYDIPHLKYIDIKFSTKCNLACRMCHPSDSSRIEDIFRDKPKDEMPHFLRNRPLYIEDSREIEKKEFVKNAIDNGLEVLKVTGGEPFASRAFLDIIDWCIENEFNKNLQIMLTTNATKFNKPLLNKLSKFRRVDFNISMDGTKEVYNYIRWGSNWDLFNKSIDNLKEFIKAYPKVFSQPRVSAILQPYNLYDIVNMYHWSIRSKLFFSVDYQLKPDTSELNVKYLSGDILKSAAYEIVTKCDKSWYDHQVREDLIDYLMLEHEENETKHNELLETTLVLDKQRNQDYHCLDSRIVEFLDSVRNKNEICRY